MPKVALTEQYLEDIADAIRAKNESETLYKPPEMASAILALPAGGGIIPTGTISITSNGTHNVYNYASANVQVSSTINNQNKTVNPSTSQQSITADSGYTGLGTVTVEAMPSGTAGTPTASKGAVSNHSINVTPSVTNTTGYITGGTKTGTAVSVSASELDSGTKSITENGTGIDVVGYAAVDVSVSGGVDMPTFTLDSTMTSVTCDKTFAECLEYANNDVLTALADTPYGPMTAYNAEGSSTQLRYIISDPIPEADIVYNSNGTLNLVMPSTYRETLSITQNGTYYPSQQNKAITEVSVSVSGGAINNQNKTVTSSGTLQTVTYDSGYTGLGTVTINAAPSAGISSSFTGQFITENNTRKWQVTPSAYAESSGWVSEGSIPSATPTKYSAIASNTTITPTESTQTIGGSNYMMEGAVTIGAIDSEYVGSLVPRVTATDITVSGPTVTMPSGFYGTELTKTVASGSATGPSSLSGTSATVSTGTNTLTLTKTGVSTTPTVSAGYVSSATASTATVTLTANVTTQAASTYYPSTSDQTISASRYLTGAQTIKAVTTSNLTAANIKKDVVVTVGDSADADRIISVTGTYEGGGAALTVDTATATLSSASTSISFTGLAGEPTSFTVVSAAELATGASPWKTAAVVFDGTNLHGQTIRNTSNAQVTYDGSSFSKTYSNGTLTITGSGTNFQANQYKLVYTYGGSDIETADVQVGSGATSITFTGLEEEPSYFSCIFKSNFSTSSGYQRVIVVVYDGTSTYGMEMDSSAKASTAHWTHSYSSGSLTITSSGTNAGGYFHQPGYYQLTYAVEGSSGNYQSKTVYATSSQQVVQADSGYDALKKVTIPAVTTTNLIASNIVSGVTVQVGDAADSDRIASVTGNVVLQNYYTGSSAPSSSTGSNGDLYLQS